MARTVEFYVSSATEAFTAGFISKAAQKSALDDLSRAANLLKADVHQLTFDVRAAESRKDDMETVYWMNFDLHVWNAKRRDAFLKLAPEGVAIADQFDTLSALREQIKAAEVVKAVERAARAAREMTAFSPEAAAVAKISASLEAIFAPMDAKVLEESQAWAVGRVAALREFKASERYQELRTDRNHRALYEALYNVAGGVTWYNVFNGTGPAYVSEFMAKNCANVAKKRNAGITTKLIKAGVSEVVSESYTHTNDGFNGVFIVNTDTGQKRVTIDTIYAGGYNIQCLHLRVLVKVK